MLRSKLLCCSHAGAPEEPPPYTVLSTCKGADLKGTRYKPLFNYFVPEFKDTAWRVCNDTYVTSDSGTGVVHQAPAFGEDDYRCALHNIIFAFPFFAGGLIASIEYVKLLKAQMELSQHKC